MLYTEAASHFRPQAKYFWAPVLRQCDSCEPLLATECEFVGAKMRLFFNPLSPEF